MNQTLDQAMDDAISAMPDGDACQLTDWIMCHRYRRFSPEIREVFAKHIYQAFVRERGQPKSDSFPPGAFWSGTIARRSLPSGQAYRSSHRLLANLGMGSRMRPGICERRAVSAVGRENHQAHEPRQNQGMVPFIAREAVIE
jgi:hypothetical protein